MGMTPYPMVFQSGMDYHMNMEWMMTFHMAMDQYLWKYQLFRGNIHKSQLFWCEQKGYKVLTHPHITWIQDSWNLKSMISRGVKKTKKNLPAFCSFHFQGPNPWSIQHFSLIGPRTWPKLSCRPSAIPMASVWLQIISRSIEMQSFEDFIRRMVIILEYF